ncbi:MAG: mechanosensitive ion channel [Actinomycetota bacterium]|nr:mechanosensitive ion channel [Actinomycetota bacterium]
MTANLFVDSLSKLWDGFLVLLPKIGIALVALLIFYLVARIACLFIGRYLGKLRVSEIAVQLISRAAFIAVIVIGVMVSLGVMGINAVTLIASAGLLRAALGFALKGVIENFAAGLLVVWQRPFETGDTVIIGEVEEVRVRDTVVRMYDGRRAFVPNVGIFSHEVINNTSSGRRRLDFQVGVA